MPTGNELGDRLAQARRELAVRQRRDVTQADVAAAVGTTGATVSRWEAGLTVPKEAALAKLAHVLGVTPAYLRYGIEGAPGPEPAPPDHEHGARAYLEANKKAAPHKAARKRRRA